MAILYILLTLLAMARQDGIIKITGTIGDITFYMMDGVYYARMKSCLTGKRFWKDKAFEGSRRSAIALGKASKLASRLYRTISPEDKSRGLFCKLTGEIKLLIKTEHSEEEIIKWFFAIYHAVELPNELTPGLKIQAFAPPKAEFHSSLYASNQIVEKRERLLVLKE